MVNSNSHGTDNKTIPQFFSSFDFSILSNVFHFQFKAEMLLILIKSKSFVLWLNFF